MRLFVIKDVLSKTELLYNGTMNGAYCTDDTRLSVRDPTLSHAHCNVICIMYLLNSSNGRRRFCTKCYKHWTELYNLYSCFQSP